MVLVCVWDLEYLPRSCKETLIYVVLKHFIFPNRTALVHLHRQINIQHSTGYAARSNTRNQIISPEQTWQLYITQQREDEGLKCVTSHKHETQTACWNSSNIIMSFRNYDLNEQCLFSQSYHASWYYRSLFTNWRIRVVLKNIKIYIKTAPTSSQNCQPFTPLDKRMPCWQWNFQQFTIFLTNLRTEKAQF
jgi:hypothetical protein